LKTSKKLNIDKQSISIKYIRDNLYKTVWYDINEEGNINKSLTSQAAVHIYKNNSITLKNPRYYIGSIINLKTRISSYRYYILNWNKCKNKGSGSSKFYRSVLKHNWLRFKFGVLEYINLYNNIDIGKKKKILLEKEQYYLDNINQS
jgi:hypothetical protein